MWSLLLQQQMEQALEKVCIARRELAESNVTTEEYDPDFDPELVNQALLDGLQISSYARSVGFVIEVIFALIATYAYFEETPKKRKPIAKWIIFALLCNASNAFGNIVFVSVSGEYLSFCQALIHVLVWCNWGSNNMIYFCLYERTKTAYENENVLCFLKWYCRLFMIPVLFTGYMYFDAFVVDEGDGVSSCGYQITSVNHLYTWTVMDTGISIAFMYTFIAPLLSIAKNSEELKKAVVSSRQHASKNSNRYKQIIRKNLFFSSVAIITSVILVACYFDVTYHYDGSVFYAKFFGLLYVFSITDMIINVKCMMCLTSCWMPKALLHWTSKKGKVGVSATSKMTSTNSAFTKQSAESSATTVVQQ